MSEVQTPQAAQSTNPAAEGKTVLTEPVEPKAEAQAQPKADESTVNPNSEPKTQDAPAENKDVPLSYDLKIPEGSILKPEQVDELSAFAKEHKLHPDVAQKVLERESASVLSFAQAQQDQMKNAVAGWLDLTKKDKDFGGEKWAENATYAKQVIQKFGDEDLKKALDETGLGNHPALFRLAARIGKSMANDKAVFSGHTTTPEKKSHAEILYGPTQPEQ